MKILLVLILSSATYASAATYMCEAQDGVMTDQEVSVAKQKVTVSSTDKVNGMNFSAKLDPTYKPKGAPKVRYLGKDGKYKLEVVLSKNMVSDAKTGYMQIRGNQDGYWSANYTCTVKTTSNDEMCLEIREENENQCREAICEQSTEHGETCDAQMQDGDFNVEVQECAYDETEKSIARYNKKNPGKELNCDDL